MTNTQKIKQKALAPGFQSVGIAQAGFLEEEAPRLEKRILRNKGLFY